MTAAMLAHHRRRLARVGWERALDAPAGGWADVDPPPRNRNSLEVLIDGAAALPAIAEELLAAESHVRIAGWFFTPSFALIRDREAPVLRDLLAEPTRIEGPAVADVARHFDMRWGEVTGELSNPPAPAAPAGEVELQVVRTVPERVYGAVRRGDFGILESYVRALRSAERFVYLENQFLWSPEIEAVLIDKLRNPPSDDFRLLALLPSHANSGADDTRGVLGELLQADGGAGRVLAATILARSGPRADQIYVHAKVGIVDDAWLTIGSANLNEHSLFNDTEMNVVTHDPALARTTRLRLWSEHLERPIDEIDGDPTAVIGTVWRPIAEEQLARREAGLPLTHRLVRLPNVSRRSSRLRGPVSGLFVDG
jgi:phosphatidylserine/phosphatidylglycerophosphate/cardiolipin synthase-like enzyme